MIEAYREQAVAKARSRLQALVREHLSGCGVRHEAVVGYGQPGVVLREQVERLNADLLVVGRQARSSAHELFLGSVTAHLLAEAGSDLLVVPPSISNRDV